MRLSVSATDGEWAAVHERARQGGLSISRYLVGLLLPDAAMTAPHAAPLPALSGVEQREVLEAVRHMRLLLSEAGAPGVGSTGMPDRSSASPDTEEAALAGDGRMKELRAAASAGRSGDHIETGVVEPPSTPGAAENSNRAETGETEADPDAPDQGALF